MNKKASKKSKTKTRPRITKRDVWFSYFINPLNKRTFLNKAESAKAAGYKASSEPAFRSIGSENFAKLSERIENWLEQEGLSDNALKIKLIELLEGQETKTITLKGEINKEELPDNAQIIASGVVTKYNQEGYSYQERETILGINMENKELQRRSLDMAFKMKGSYAPEKHDHNVKGEVRHTHEQALNRALEQKAKIAEEKNNERGSQRL